MGINSRLNQLSPLPHLSVLGLRIGQPTNSHHKLGLGSKQYYLLFKLAIHNNFILAYPNNLCNHKTVMAKDKNASKHCGIRSHRTAILPNFLCIHENVRST